MEQFFEFFVLGFVIIFLWRIRNPNNTVSILFIKLIFLTAFVNIIGASPLMMSMGIAVYEFLAMHWKEG